MYNDPMLTFTNFAGVIFDVDGTLLDDRPPGEAMGLHEQSRMLAAHEVGRQHNLASLLSITPEQCAQAFKESQAHVIHAVVWQMLVIAGVVSEQQQMDYEHPLVQEIVELKEELHEEILRTKG